MSVAEICVKRRKKMPIYEYKCRQCDYKFELLRSSNADDTDLKCPECNAQGPVKLFSAFSSKGGNDNCSPGAST